MTASACNRRWYWNSPVTSSCKHLRYVNLAPNKKMKKAAFYSKCLSKNHTNNCFRLNVNISERQGNGTTEDKILPIFKQ